jgi:hypothetical protein
VLAWFVQKHRSGKEHLRSSYKTALYDAGKELKAIADEEIDLDKGAGPQLRASRRKPWRAKISRTTIKNAYDKKVQD